MEGITFRRPGATRLPLERHAPLVALLLTAALLAGMCLLAGMLIWQSYAETVRTAENRAASAAEIVAAQARWLSEAAFQSLQRIDDTLGARPDLFIPGTVGDLDNSVSSLPVRVQAWVFDADGELVLTNDENALGPVNVLDRDYFSALREGEERYISPLLVGRVSGVRVFVFSKRIERRGVFMGVAAIGVPQTLMAEFWGSLDLGPDSSVSLLRDDGMIVARYPVIEETMDMSSRELFTKYLKAAPAGYYHGGGSPADGVSRIVGYSTVPDLPLIAVAGISQDAALSGFWSSVRSAAVVATPVALALLSTSLWVAYLLRGYDRQRHELSVALDHNRVLLREVHHRVKNNLAAVTALVRLQGLSPDATRDVTSRINAMAAIHERMYLSDRFATLDFADYIRRLADSLQASAPDRVKVVCGDLDTIEIDADTAMPLGLIVNEAATNALKHAFPGSRRGTVAISLRQLAGNQAELQVRDDGIGFDRKATPKGMGSRLIEGLSRQAEATTAYRRDDGTVFTARFPVVVSAETSDPVSGNAEKPKPRRGRASRRGTRSDKVSA